MKTEEELLTLSEVFGWDITSYVPGIPLYFIEKYKDKINFKQYLKNHIVSIYFLDKFSDYIDFEDVILIEDIFKLSDDSLKILKNVDKIASMKRVLNNESLREKYKDYITDEFLLINFPEYINLEDIDFKSLNYRYFIDNAKISIINKYAKYLDWDKISELDLSIKFKARYSKYLNLGTQEIILFDYTEFNKKEHSYDFFRISFSVVNQNDIDNISKITNLSLTFIDKYKDILNWKYISEYHKDINELIETFPDYVNPYIAIYSEHLLKNEKILSFFNKYIDWNILVSNNEPEDIIIDLKFNFILEYFIKDLINAIISIYDEDLSSVFYNNNDILSKYINEIISDKLLQTQYFYNLDIPDDIIEKYKDKIVWKWYLSYRILDKDFILKYKEYISIDDILYAMEHELELKK